MTRPAALAWDVNFVFNFSWSPGLLDIWPTAVNEIRADRYPCAHSSSLRGAIRGYNPGYNRLFKELKNPYKMGILAGVRRLP
jgi:hypothetical protein